LIYKIEVYVKNEEIPVRTGFVRGPIDHHCLDKDIFKTEKVMPEADRLALEVVNEFAKEKGVLVDVCNVSTLGGRLKANIKRIGKTPVVIVGKDRIEGEQSSELLKNKLKSYF